MRKSRAAEARNRAQRSTLRTALKKAKSTEGSAADRAAAVQLVDRAARKGLIHKNAAARHKSRLAKNKQSQRGELAAAALAVPLRRVVHRAAFPALERLLVLARRVCGRRRKSARSGPLPVGRAPRFLRLRC